MTDYVVAFCDVCRQAPMFTSSESRDKWLTTHVHVEDE